MGERGGGGEDIEGEKEDTGGEGAVRGTVGEKGDTVCIYVYIPK